MSDKYYNEEWDSPGIEYWLKSNEISRFFRTDRELQKYVKEHNLSSDKYEVSIVHIEMPPLTIK